MSPFEEKAIAMHTIIFFVPSETLWLRQLMDEVARRLPRDTLAVCRTAEELIESVLTSFSGATTVVLAVLTHDDLGAAVSLKGLLKSVRNLLILPDDSSEALNKALSLQCCYHTSANRNQHELVAVLEKISAQEDGRGGRVPERVQRT